MAVVFLQQFPAPYQCLDPFVQVFQHKRFGDIFVRPRSDPRYLLLNGTFGRKYDGGNMRGAQIFLQGFYDLKAIFSRKHHITYYYVGHYFKGKPQPCGTIVRFFNVVHGLKSSLYKLPQFNVVIYQQNGVILFDAPVHSIFHDGVVLLI